MNEHTDVRVFIGIGSNIEPFINVPAAIDRLKSLGRLSDVSTFYRTEPIGRPDQPLYINGVVRIYTSLTPEALKTACRVIESDLGRSRSEDKYASRAIDLDILLYGDHVIKTRNISIPDEAIETRPFVAHPIREIEPGLVLPDSGESIRDVAEKIGTEGMTPLYSLTQTLKETCCE